MISNIISILVICMGTIIAAVFAGSETGVYQVSRLRLRLGIERRQFSFVMLGRCLADSPGLLISILIGTNLAHYITTSFVTFLLLETVHTEHAAELVATLITAPVLFVFSELIPKNIFYYRADTLTPYTAPFLLAFKKLCTWSGLEPLLKIITRFVARLTGTPVASKTITSAILQPHIKAIIEETHEEGFLSPVQTDIINRLTSISHLSIKSVMIPIGKARMLNIRTDRDTLIKILKQSSFTRLLVYDNKPADIVGFINIYECLYQKQDFNNLHQFVKPIPRLDETTTVSHAIDFMQNQNAKMILVTKITHSLAQRSLGIVTMKDLVEELLGELTEW